jgi:hypothetical protein
MSDDLHVKYYGLEREAGGDWKPCGIIGATDDIPYADIRTAIEHLENFRVRPIENQSLWTDVFKDGKIIEFKTLCTAILILCTK